MCIHLRQQQAITLEISDDGVGIPGEVDVQDSNPLGLQLVNMLVGQCSGTMQVCRDRGTQVTIGFERRPVAG